MGPSTPSLNCKLSRLLDPQQQRKRQSSFSGDLVKIQKVPPYLRQRSEFNNYYFPKVISIGPIHHPKGEDYKEMWATMYLQDKLKGQQQQQEEEAQKLVGNMNYEIQALKACYTEDVIQELDDDKLAWILFLDGCATLHVMAKVDPTEPSKLQVLYRTVQQDLLLLENQLPYQVLRILSKNDDSSLKNLRKRFLQTLDIVPVVSQLDSLFQYHHPAHLLDLLIKSIVAADDIKIDRILPSGEKPKKLKTPTVHRSIQELVTAGIIKIKKSNNVRNLTSIDFILSRGGLFCGGGELHIPPLTFDDFTAQMLMNMMAYERCPDSKSEYEISNYALFLNSLIDHAEDVKVLRKAGVVNNLLGSDEEVAQIFNTASTDLVLDTGIYNHVRTGIEQLYARKVTLELRIWFSELRRKHFNTPWAVIGLMAFILGLVSTIVNLEKEFGPKRGSPPS